MPRARYNWRDNLSQPRYTPDQIQAQQLRNQAAQIRIDQAPLQQEAREAQLARAQGAEAQARYKLQKEIETDRQKAAFYNGLQELESTLEQRGWRIGTKEHAEAFASYAHAFPLARSSADVNKTLEIHAKVNDDQAALSQRIQTALGAVPEGYTPKGLTVTGTGQPSVQFSTGEVPEKVKLRYGFLQSNITGHLSEAQKQAGKATLPDQPYEHAGQLNANVDEANFLREQYPDLPPVKGLIMSDTGMGIPKAGKQPSADIAAPTATPTVAPTATPTPAESQDVAAPTATPKHLGRYNPQTGEFE